MNNKIILRYIIFLVNICAVSSAFSQTISPAILKNKWNAFWITGPGVTSNQWATMADPSLKEYGVYKFRKQIDLAVKPASFIVHVSGDNRYKLYVNEKLVSQGPARGDLYFWNFETVDLAPFLVQGKNTVAALVWNDGKLKPEAQISFMTAFILQGNTPKEEILNTDTSWKSIRDSSYTPLPVKVPGYYVAGPAEMVNMKVSAKGWERMNYSDTAWPKARMLFNGLTKDAAIDSRGWMLIPSSLPQMEMTMQRLAKMAKAENVTVDPAFPAVKKQIIIPAGTKATLLLDQGFLTNAYPTVIFSKGNNTGISLGYAEGLYEPEKDNKNGFVIASSAKGNRDEPAGKIFIGKTDSVVSDGSDNQVYSPLWWRTYRYIQLRINTREEPLIIDDVYGTFTGYPFIFNAQLETGNPVHKQMLDIGWRTARLCAFETYMDCPYYEQLQYLGDARIQAMVSLYNSGDDRLVKNVITLADHSRIAEGITLSRYPTDLHQQIPTFSLWWIGMLHDYWMYGSDTAFIADKLAGERQVLHFFNRYQQTDGSLKDVPYWNFCDWVSDEKWKYGMAPAGENGESALLDIQLLWTYKLAAEMEAKMGLPDFARLYSVRAAQLIKTIQNKYWDNKRQLYGDTEERKSFSQHVNSLAILAGLINGKKAEALGRKLSDTSLTQATIYFKYYVHQALIKAGLGNDYLNWLDIWKENIAMGLTTWAEISDVTNARSDCHAWGSSLNIEFFRTVLGIDSDAPGFRKVRIEPHLGLLQNLSGQMPHPAGKVKVDYKKSGASWNMQIELPENIAGSFIFQGKTYILKGGKNLIKI